MKQIKGGDKNFMEDNPYFITLTPEEFHWLWEDIDLALQPARKKTSGPLEGIKRAIGKADREHVCIDEINQLS